MALLLLLAKRLDSPGYLVLDDVVVEKAGVERLRWAAHISSPRNARSRGSKSWSWCGVRVMAGGAFHLGFA